MQEAENIEVVTEEEPTVEVELGKEEEEEGAPPRGEHEPSLTHPRFKEVYGKMKTYERELEGLKSSLESERVAARDHNQKLVSAIEKMSSKTIESLEAKETKETTASQMGHLNSALEDLEERKTEAMKDGEYKSVGRIDREIRRVERAMEMVEIGSKRAAPTPSSPPQDITDPDIEEFVRNAKWWEKDPIMTGAAKELDWYLSNEPKWRGKPLKERLQEVKKVVEDRFAWKGAKPSGAESGMGQPGGKMGDGTTRIRLNSEQVAAAKGLGLTPTEYAHQLVLMGGGK
jgi:hypothetical protein